MKYETSLPWRKDQYYYIDDIPHVYVRDSITKRDYIIPRGGLPAVRVSDLREMGHRITPPTSERIV